MVSPVLLGAFDVAILRALVSATEEDHDSIPLPAEVDAVAGARVDPQLEHTFAHATCISEVSQANPRDSLPDPVSRGSVPQSP